MTLWSASRPLKETRISEHMDIRHVTLTLHPSCPSQRWQGFVVAPCYIWFRPQYMPILADQAQSLGSLDFEGCSIRLSSVELRLSWIDIREMHHEYMYKWKHEEIVNKRSNILRFGFCCALIGYIANTSSVNEWQANKLITFKTTLDNGKHWGAYNASRDASKSIEMRTLVGSLILRKSNDREIFDAMAVSPNRCFRTPIPRDLVKLALLSGIAHGM